MKTLSTVLAGLLIAGLAFATGSLADDSSFSENQSLDDQLFHIDIGASFLQTGKPPRDHNSGVGTIKISLPGSHARFDPSLPIDQSGYTCSVTTSSYGEPNAGYICSTDGQAQGGGLVFPNAVTAHLLSDNCYAPPPEGSAQPAVAEVWAAPGDPGGAPDASYPLYSDPGCDTGAADDNVDKIPVLKCIVPKLKNLTLPKATKKLKAGACKRGKVKKAYSGKVKKGRVMKQSKKAGKKLKANTKVNLVVSKGKKP